MAHVQKARVFRNGRSQAVRIPAEYRFTSDEVYIRRNAATGEVTLSERLPRPDFDAIFAELDSAGAADLSLERDVSVPSERELL